MNRDFWLLLVLLLVNLAVALIYLIFHMKKGNRKKGILVMLFMLAFPIVGACFLALAELSNYLLHQREVLGLDLSDLSFSQERVRVLTDADIEKELNIVPVEEALIISTKRDRRRAFINLLKDDDFEDTLPQIQDAVENDDMEVSHYAASFVTDVLARYKAKEAELRAKVDKNPCEENFSAYLSYMEEVLERDVFSTVELKIYVVLFDRCAALMYAADPERLGDHTISVLIDLWKKLGRNEKILPWVERARSRCRDSLAAFKLCAGYYYSVGDRESFMLLLEEIKHFSVALDHESLEWIRFFKTGKRIGA